MGGGKAVLIDFNYDTGPLPGPVPSSVTRACRLLKPSRLNHWGKLAFRWVYWHMLLGRGRKIPFVPAPMKMTGKKRPDDRAGRTSITPPGEREGESPCPKKRIGTATEPMSTLRRATWPISGQVDAAKSPRPSAREEGIADLGPDPLEGHRVLSRRSSRKTARSRASAGSTSPGVVTFDQGALRPVFPGGPARKPAKIAGLKKVLSLVSQLPG
ncbi:MAG: TusE/DsrC/DsvC family sulfur relay protein [Marinilabiliales bacterium]|nr:TusE/DsrC/DsvC family sulfur relay protein [Marinilabiliales bacterium]